MVLKRLLESIVYIKMTVKELHDKAMELADQAFFSQKEGTDLVVLRYKFEQAYTFERQAAALLKPILENEPTRSILYRSAGWLALNSDNFDKAMECVEQGLLGEPPSELMEELGSLKDKILEKAFYA